VYLPAVESRTSNDLHGGRTFAEPRTGEHLVDYVLAASDPFSGCMHTVNVLSVLYHQWIISTGGRECIGRSSYI
jgi:hypothetical protein